MIGSMPKQKQKQTNQIQKKILTHAFTRRFNPQNHSHISLPTGIFPSHSQSRHSEWNEVK